MKIKMVISLILLSLCVAIGSFVSLYIEDMLYMYFSTILASITNLLIISGCIYLIYKNFKAIILYVTNSSLRKTTNLLISSTIFGFLIGFTFQSLLIFSFR
jgi:hypothetical protein